MFYGILNVQESLVKNNQSVESYDIFGKEQLIIRKDIGRDNT